MSLTSQEKKINSISADFSTDGYHLPSRRAIILAGGEGTRLRTLTRLISGDDRPKQFCKIMDSETLLERTIKRAEIKIPHEKIVISLTEAHEKYFQEILSRWSRPQLVIQPDNLGTAPAILYSLIRIFNTDPECSVAIFPSDHYISDDDVFMDQIEASYDLAESQPGKVVLIGITPENPETGYGWIEPYPSNRMDEPQYFGVRRFWEKPSFDRASMLMKKKCLWNSFVMVGLVSSFMDMIMRSLPELYRNFLPILNIPYSSIEKDMIETIYADLDSTNFSSEILEKSTEDLLVMKLAGVEWNDLGEPRRVLSTFQNLREDLGEYENSLIMQTG